MVMHRLLGLAALAIGISLSGSASAEKSAMTTTLRGHDLEVVIHDVTDYCSTKAHTEVIRKGDSIRIIRERPSHVSRCMSSRDVTVVVHDVPAGTYHVTYERIPLVAPARALTLASTTAIVKE